MSHGLDSGMWKFVIAWTIAAFGGMLVVIIALKGSAGGPCRNLGADEARRYIEEKRPFILDVRSAAEQSRGVIRGAVCLPLNQLGGRLSEVPQERLLCERYAQSQGGFVAFAPGRTGSCQFARGPGRLGRGKFTHK